jgi:hypothetical protein
MSYSVTFLALSTAFAVQASAPLAVQAQAPTSVLAGPVLARPVLAGAPDYPYALPAPSPDVAPPEPGHAKECYAKVKFGAQYSVEPPAGPHYSWRQEPGPPGAPGPIWCLVPDVSAPQRILISPERYGWVRILCETEATAARIVEIQRQLYAAGVYHGPINGRYDSNTVAAIELFQAQHHIEDRGYLSYATLSALSVYSQAIYQQTGYVQGGYSQNGYYQAPYPYPYPYPQAAYAPPYPYGYPPARPDAYGGRPLTTFDTGVITWPGKR